MTEEGQAKMESIRTAIGKSKFKVLNRYDGKTFNITRRRWYNRLPLPLSGFGKVEYDGDRILLYPWMGMGFAGLPELGKIIAKETNMEVTIIS